MTRSDTAELQAEALTLLRNGTSVMEVAKRVGRTERTITTWIRKNGWQAEVDASRTATNRRRAEQRRAEWAVRKFDEANAAGLEAGLVRRRLHDLVPGVGQYRIQVVVEESDGPKGPERTTRQQLVPVVPANDVKALATTYGILVDKAQLLSGDATQRSDVRQMSESEVDQAIHDLVQEINERARLDDDD